MAQIQTHFERPLLKIGSITFLVGAAIMIISTMLHPSKEDPFNHPLVLAEYTKSNIWVTIHLGQFAGGIIVFIGGFGAIYRLL